MRRVGALLCATTLLATAPAAAQSLSDEQLAAVRRGAASSRLPGGATTVPLVGPPTLPLVEARVNGAGPFRLLLDLGSNVTILRRDVVDAAGVEVVLDRERSDIVRADTLSVGACEFRDVWMGAYDELDVDGVIGYNLLSARPFTLDYPGARLILGAAELPDPAGELVVEDRLPFVAARLGGREVLLNLDTGAAEEMTVPPQWEEWLPVEGEPVPGPMTHNNQTGATRVRVARLGEELRVAGVGLGRPLVYLNPDAEDAWLGSGLLKDYVLAVDPEQRLYGLSRPGGPATAP
ncbi:MAG TPA: aspartyl protease family protein [Thermoanaerobaculia bacterium]|nr:aspartyl protease family protein [Thermoanaerobaculia bacterium]